MKINGYHRGSASAAALLCALHTPAIAQTSLPTINIGVSRPGISRSTAGVSRPASSVAAQRPGESRSTPGGVVVQNTPAPPPPPEDSVVVQSPTRTEKKISEAPGDVTVFNRDFIQRRDSPRIGAVLRDSPGIYSWGNSLAYASPSSNRAGRFSFRGISGQQRTLFMLDDQILNDPMFGTFNYLMYFMDDIERIETLAGASSALYGANAFGGVVRAYSKIPEKREILARGEAGFGAFQQQTGDIIYRDRIADGKIGFSAGMRYQGSTGFKDNIIQAGASLPYILPGADLTFNNVGTPVWNIGEAGEAKWRAFNGNFRLYYDHDELTKFGAGVQYLSNTSSPDWFESYVTPQLADAYNKNPRVPPPNKITPQLFLNAGLAWESTLVTYFNVKRKLGENAEFKFNINNMSRNYAFTTPGRTNPTTALGGPGGYNAYPQNLFSAHSQLTFRVDSLPLFAHNITSGAGVDNGAATLNATNVWDWTNPGTITTPVTGSNSAFVNATSRFVWAYGQDEVKLTDWLTAYVGARVDWWRNAGTNVLGNGSATYNTGKNILQFNPKVSLVAKMPWEDAVMRANAGRAFRPPVLNNLYVTSARATTLSQGNPNLSPETEIGWDFGYEQSFNASGTFIKATFYETYLNNLILSKRLSSSPTLNISTTSNTGQAIIRGWEMQGSQQLLEWLTANISYTNVVQAQVSAAQDNPAAIGKRLPNSPENIFSGWLEATYGDWAGVLTGRYTSDSYDTAENLDFVRGVYGSFDSFYGLDARIQWRPTKYTEFYFAANNLTGQKYYQFTVNPGTFFTTGMKMTF